MPPPQVRLGEEELDRELNEDRHGARAAAAKAELATAVRGPRGVFF